MKQRSLKSIARVALLSIILTFVLTLVGSVQSHALSFDDLGISYNSSNGIETTEDSVWNKDTNQDAAWKKIFDKYKGIIIGLSGIATLTMVVLFILNFMKLGQSAGNPQAKSQALTGLLWTCIAAAGAGGVTLFVGSFSNMLKD